MGLNFEANTLLARAATFVPYPLKSEDTTAEFRWLPLGGMEV
jgi:hypothetical protein